MPPHDDASPAAPAETRALRGSLALEVTHSVTDPVRGLRDRLGLVVDHLERHVSTSTGPTPYPWRSLQTLRQDLAAAYLEVTTIARRLDELDRATRDDSHAVTSSFDCATIAEQGLRLAQHHLATNQFEQLFDLATGHRARGVAGTTALVIAQLVAVCARSALGAPSSALSVRVWLDTDDASGTGTPVITIADNGAGDLAAAEDASTLARAILEPWGATIDAASAPGQGCTFELRLRAG